MTEHTYDLTDGWRARMRRDGNTATLIISNRNTAQRIELGTDAVAKLHKIFTAVDRV
jgi:hypothetical protein